MSNSLVPVGAEERLAQACYVGNFLDRLGLMTDTILAAATGVDDLIADLYANLVVSGTQNDKFERGARIGLRYFEQQIKYLNLLGKLTDVQVAALTDWDTADADTSLRHLFAKWVTITGFSKTSSEYNTAVFAQGVTA